MEVNLKACKKSNGSEGNHFSLLVCHLNIWTFVEFIEMECIRSDMRLICHTLDDCARCIQNELFLWAYHHFLLICESRDVGLLHEMQLVQNKIAKTQPNAFHVCFIQTHRQLDIPFHMFVVCMTMRLFVFCGMGWVVDNVVFCLFYEFFFSVFPNFFKPIDVYVGNF